MKRCPYLTLATATARAQRLESATPTILAQVTTNTVLNASFFAERLTALRGVHRRQLARLQERVQTLVKPLLADSC